MRGRRGRSRGRKSHRGRKGHHGRGRRLGSYSMQRGGIRL